MKPYPAYKDSGVEWIGEVPEGWEVTKVKFLSLTPVQYGLNIGAENYTQDGVRFIRTTDIDDYGNLMKEGVFLPEHLVQKEYLLHDGDFLVSRSGTVGRAYVHSLNDKQCSYAGYLVRFTFNDSSVAKLLFYFTKSDIFNVWLESTGIESTIVNVNGQKYANLSIALPTDKTEQAAIAAYLDRKTAQIDTLIKQKRRLIQLLQEERTALISQAVTKGIGPDSQIGAVFKTAPISRKMKDSGIEWIGEVPEGWEVASLGYVCGLISGGTPDRNRADYWNGDIPWVKTGEVSFNIINDTEEYITDLGLANSSAKLALPRTILMAMYGQGVTRGRVAILGIEATFNQACLAITPGNRMETKYLFYYLMNAYNFVRDIGNETSQMNLSSGVIAKIKVLTPPLPEQTAIAAYLDQKTTQIDQTIARTERQIELLQEYRTALISAAVTGKIDVREEKD